MSILDLFFPKFCINCHFPGGYICLNCQPQLSYSKSQRCFFCKKYNSNGIIDNICLKKFNIKRIDYIFIYNRLLQKIIKTTKYRLATEVWKELKLIIKPERIIGLGFYKNLGDNTYLQPIPLSKNKIRERGFNQAFLIAQFFKNYLNIPISNFLERTKDTKNQAELNKKQRKHNLKNAFKIIKKKKRLNGLRIILVDDVITTGSTIIEAAKVLKKAKVKEIYVLALAKG